MRYVVLAKLKFRYARQISLAVICGMIIIAFENCGQIKAKNFLSKNMSASAPSTSGDPVDPGTNSAIRIVTDPISVSAALGAQINLTVVVEGLGDLHYQWYFGSQQLQNSDHSVYTIASLSQDNVGSYYVVVTAGSLSATSRSATVAVADQPTALPSTPADPNPDPQPTASAACVAPDATQQYIRQSVEYFRNGINTYAAAGAQECYTNVSTGVANLDLANWPCQVAADFAGYVQACVTWVQNTLSAPPAIVTQPQSASVSTGSTFSLSVSTTGPSPSYQWFFNGVAISGATQSTYQVQVSAQTAGAYYVQVTNANGQINSETVNVTATGCAANPWYNIGAGAVGQTLSDGQEYQVSYYTCQADGTWLRTQVACGAAYPPPNYGVRENQCLPSCGALGGRAAFTDSCANHNMSDVGRAYDTQACCVPMPRTDGCPVKINGYCVGG